MMISSSRAQQGFLILTCWFGGLVTCLIYFQYTSQDCQPPAVISPITEDVKSLNEIHSYPPPTAQSEKPIVLLWVWPEDFKFSFDDCKTIYNIDVCHLTDDRNLYNQADAVLIYHKAISSDLSNLPPSPRPSFQRWVWFHLESPTNTRKIPGLENLFNLTLSYRRGADISVNAHPLTIRKTPNEEFVPPKKDNLVCWFVSNTNPYTGTATRMKYYEELKKHINITIFGKLSGKRIKDEEYNSIMASCKFYLSFENSIHKDYITEKFNGPLGIGTVPVAMGPPRENYEQYAPGNSFIHVNDFPDAAALAQYLLQLDKDDEAYKRYFDWRKHFSARRNLDHFYQEFIPQICHACEYIVNNKEYKQVHDLYTWYFS